MILDGSVRVSKPSVLVVSGGGATNVLQVDVGDVQGAAPQFRVVNTTMHEVKIYPCVISRMGRPSPITQSHLDTMLAEVNTIFRQVGMHFSYGAPITNVTNSTWTENGLIDQFTGSKVRNIMYGTDGLEVYFISGLNTDDERKKDEPIGKCNSYGIILRYGASANVLAHELGHACLWPDIYVRRKKNEPEILKEYLRSSWMPDDWDNGTGQRYYGQLLQQRDMIERLLMHGVDKGVHVDMPLGPVYGLGKDGVVGLMNIGRNGVMTFSPISQ